MSSEDILSELVNTVKELTEKNFSLSLKVNELENKITQVEQNKKDITALKTGFDAATTDRTAIKDLLNLKINEVKSDIEERIKSVKNDIILVKEDMNHLGNDYSSIKENITKISSDMEKNLKNISNETIKNLESIRSVMEQKITNNLESISNLQKDLESKTIELNSSINSTNATLQTRFEELTNNFQAADLKITEEITKGNSDINTTIQSNQDQMNRKLEEVVTSLQAALKEHEETNNNSFEKAASETASELQQLNDSMNTKVESQASMITNLSSQTEMNLNTLKNQIEKFFDISDNHSQVLKVFEEIIGQIRSNIEQASLETKNDQELLLESFQKIIVGQAENLRNELLTFSKEIRTNVSKFSEETDKKYTSLDETTKINEKLKSLDNELRSRSENIRKEVISTVEESVQKFNTAIKESISSVDEYRVDLERFKDDIESLVERKVNEKNEFSMELLNNLLTKAEHISKLVQDTKVSKVPSIAVPIPEIKNSERGTE